MTEVVNGLLVLALLPDDDVDPEPVERVFVIKIRSAPPGMPGIRRKIKLGSRVGRVLQVAPGTPGSVVERGGGYRQIIALLVRCEQAAAGGQHSAQVIS